MSLACKNTCQIFLLAYVLIIASGYRIYESTSLRTFGLLPGLHILDNSQPISLLTLNDELALYFGAANNFPTKILCSNMFGVARISQKAFTGAFTARSPNV